MWQWTSSSSQHFHQCCFQVLNVRHRIWWYTVFRKWLTDASGRWRWSSILVRLGKIVSLCPIHCSGYLEKIASSYCIYFFLEKKKRCYYLDFCLSERILSSPPILCVITKMAIFFSSDGITPQIFNIPVNVWVQWSFKLSWSL